MTTLRSPLAVPLVALLGLVACGADQDPALDSSVGASTTTVEEATGCGPVITDELDPTSPQHALPGAAEHEYLVDPPTSGKHAPLSTDQRVFAEPLDEPLQVGALEAGLVLIQHRDAAPEDRAQLEALAGPEVAVAPNPDLPSPVVVTAWIHTMRCSGIDLEAIQSFVAARAGGGPGGHDHG